MRKLTNHSFGAMVIDSNLPTLCNYCQRSCTAKEIRLFYRMCVWCKLKTKLERVNIKT